MSYQLSKERALEADSSSNINTSGIYTGEITQAYEVTSKNGAIGVKFDFKSPKGSTNFTLWTFSKDGKPTFQIGFIDALLAILKTPKAQKVEGVIQEYDYQVKERVEKPAETFPVFCKPITAVLQREEYVNQNGDIKFRLNLKHFLNPETLQTAKEMYEKTEAEAYKSYDYQDIAYTAPSTTGYTQEIIISDENEIPF